MQREERTTITDKEIDEVLGPIACALPKQADLILDIRAAARERRHPGSCVRCFFQLAAAAPQPAWLEQLRGWLERNIEIVACDRQANAAGTAHMRVLERMPLMLGEEAAENGDLEAYCQEVMERFHYDRAHPSPFVEMEFQYRTS
ncbi:hypothetical protein [Geminisphaera colitermitum]|uniref:hypothetical protein n=1 Tax=Geminisphaera colitermitum TaxID=1148786 RepID=UPI00019652EA|nr:hypothetical protein [Geminisphaera colitermitum]RRK02740.1 hypothetical protein Ga0100230_006510 [Opitutaceae bacterium TAV3]